MSKVKGFQEEAWVLTWVNLSFPLEPNKGSTDWGKITSQEDNYFVFSTLAQISHPRQWKQSKQMKSRDPKGQTGIANNRTTDTSPHEYGQKLKKT